MKTEWSREFRRFAGKDSQGAAIKRRRLKETKARAERREVKRALRAGDEPPEFRSDAWQVS